MAIYSFIGNFIQTVEQLNRSLIVGVVGVVIVAAAIALTLYLERGPDESRVAETAAPAATAKTETRPEQAGGGSKTPADAAATPALPAPAITPQPVRPKFDVVRVSPTGNAVIAGRAEPRAEVTVSDQNKEVGKVTADARGEWVLVPEKALKAGVHELSLASRKPATATGAKKSTAAAPPVLSKEKVILVVPEKGKDIAGRATTETSGALALAVPRDGSGGTTVLQKPAMKSENLEVPRAAPTEAQTPAARPAPKVVKRSAGELAATQARIKARERDRAETRIASSAASPTKPEKPAKPVSRLSMDAIDYNDAGKVEMSGQAPSGSRVQVYLDNKPLGATKADRTGKWRVKPSKTVPPGLYKMRVDQISGAGKVVARVELPFARAKPFGKLPRDAVVFVQPGNSLWRIARRSYGDGVRYAVIYEANRNQIRNPDLIYPGQIFYLPKVN
jgi:nucleoid-associated protein YgaU